MNQEYAEAADSIARRFSRVFKESLERFRATIDRAALKDAIARKSVKDATALLDKETLRECFAPLLEMYTEAFNEGRRIARSNQEP
jgi:hypothetical protein